MLFVLSDDLLPFCTAQSGPEIEAIQNLLLCARNGHHAITGPHFVFQALSKNRNISDRERAISLSLANRRTELPLLEQRIRYKVLIGNSYNSGKPTRRTDFTWEVNIREFNEKFLSSLVILAENMIDAELYRHAANHYQIEEKINGVVSRSIPRGGGGSQIDVELANILENGVPVLAITDGDLGFPGARSSVISDRCSALVAEERGIGWHFTVPAREIENIIPLNVLLEVSDPKNRSGAHASLEELNQCASGDSLPSRYACFKQGRTLSQIFAAERQEERGYWIGLASKLQDSRPAYRECLARKFCELEPCSCRINLGFGESVLSQVRKWLTERSSHESHKSFSSSEIWMHLGSMVFDLSIAFKVERV